MYVPGLTKKKGSSVKDRSASMPAGGVGNVASEALMSAASEAKESKKEKKNKSTIAKRKKSTKGCDSGGLASSAETGKISSQDLRSIFQSGEGAGQFGVALEVLMFHQRLKFPTLRIPLVIKQCIEYLLNSGLELEGIFRISANQTELNQFRELFNKSDGSDEVLRGKTDDPHVATGLLKLFLRELPQPLLTEQLADRFITVMGGATFEEKVKGLRECIYCLPEVNRDTLYAILALLHIIQVNRTINMMTSENLARVVGPNFLWEQANSQTDGMVSLNFMGSINTMAQFMIDNVHQLFETPTSSFEISSLPPPAFLVTKFVGHRKSVQTMATTSDHRLVWSGDSLGIVRIHSVEDRMFLKEINSGGTIYALKCVNANMWLGTSESLQIRNATSADLVKSLPGPVYALAHVGNTVWTTGEDKISIWNIDDPDSPELIGEKALARGVLVLTAQAVGERVWTADINRVLRVYDANTFELVREFTAHSRKINGIMPVGDSHVWTASDDYSIIIWDAHSLDEVYKIQNAHSGYCYGLADFGSVVWTFGWDKRICLWDTKTFKNLGELPPYHGDAIRQVVEVWDHKTTSWQAWSCSFDKTLAVWSLPKCDRPKPVSSLTLSAFHSGPPVVLVDFENLVFDVAGLQSSSSSSSSDPATPVVPAATSPVIPSIMIEPSGDKDDPLPGAVEALREMVQEGLDVYLWLGNDVYVLAQRLQWVTTHLGADWLRRLILAPEKSLISATVVIENAASATDAKVKKLPWRQVIFHRCKEGPGTPRVEVGSQRQVNTSKKKMTGWSDWRGVLL